MNSPEISRLGVRLGPLKLGTWSGFVLSAWQVFRLPSSLDLKLGPILICPSGTTWDFTWPSLDFILYTHVETSAKYETWRRS